MTDQEKLALACRTIREEIAQLDQWAEESRRGGWSTHQVKPQEERARELAYVLVKVQPA